MKFCICAVWSNGHTRQGNPVIADVCEITISMNFEVQITLNRHLDFKCLDYFNVTGTWFYVEIQVSI